MNHKAVVSSNIATFGYDPATQTMEILFKSKQGTKGGLYRYEGVTAAENALFEKAESKGAFFAKYLKSKKTQKMPEHACDCCGKNPCVCGGEVSPSDVYGQDHTGI